MTTETPGGGQADAEGNVYSDVPCTVQPARGTTVERFSRRQMTVDHVFYSPRLLQLKTDDVVVHEDGRTFLVKAFGDMAGRGVATVVYLSLQVD